MIYKRPDKPLRLSEQRREVFRPMPAIASAPKLIVVDRSTECHVTPPEVAARMVDCLDASCSMLTLEPSAGTGNLVQALLDSDHAQTEITVVEQHRQLYAAMIARTKTTGWCECFLKYSARAVGRATWA